LTCATIGETANNLVLCLDKNLSWTKFTNWNISEIIYTNGEFIGGQSDDDILWSLFVGKFDNDDDVNAFVISKSFNFDLPDNQKRIRWFWLDADAVDNYKVQITYTFDNNVPVVLEKDITIGGTYNQRVSIDAGQQGKLLKVKIGCYSGAVPPVDTQMQVKGLDIFYSVLPLRNI
jgi:hypothetical protein